MHSAKLMQYIHHGHVISTLISKETV